MPNVADRVCCSRVVMSCHARRHLIVCAVLGRVCHATPNVVRQFVLPKGDDGMPRPTSFDRMCRPKAMMACHA